MNALNSYNFTTSPLSQPTRKLRRLENQTLRSVRLRETYNRRNLNKKTTGKSDVKELDAETGLYYYGARYLDPRTSRWLSGDPAMGEYVPLAPINDEARKHNSNLPGLGGVFNYVNLHVYHYAGNNPVKFIDPDGRVIRVKGYDRVIYTWDNERNEFWTGSDRNRIYGTNDNFVNNVKESLIYLKGSSYADRIIGELSSTRRNTTIVSSTNTTCLPEGVIIPSMTIRFDSGRGLNLGDGTGSYMSAAMCLFHELKHSYSHLILGMLRRRQRDTSVDNFPNAEERYAVQTTNFAAQQLGEPEREGYKGALMPTSTVTEFYNNN